MIAQKFDTSGQRWDRYRAFHKYLKYGVVEFDTGEVIATVPFPDPDMRGLISSHGIEIVATSDHRCPQFYAVGGEAVRKAWITRGGMQYLAVDHEAGVAVRLLHFGTNFNRKRKFVGGVVPPRLEGDAVAYWPGPGCRPIGDAITVSKPRILSEQDAAQVAAMLNTCKAWAEMNGVSARQASNSWDIPLLDGTTVNWRQGSSYRPVTVAHSKLADRTFNDLSSAERLQYAFGERIPEFTETQHTYLYLSKEAAENASKAQK